jgi:hypothetical protein
MMRQPGSLPPPKPHGYRSAVAYDTAHKTWITVGPKGTDISSGMPFSFCKLESLLVTRPSIPP